MYHSTDHCTMIADGFIPFSAMIGRRLFILLEASMDRSHALLFLLAITTFACDKQDELPAHERFEFHRELSIGAPISAILDLCGASSCKIQDSDVFNEIEYVSDSAARVRGVILRTPAPVPSSVMESQEIFKRTRLRLQQILGDGQTFLKTADPTYWPERDTMTRVVTLSTDDRQRTVLAVGAVGPDGERAPAFSAARDQINVHTYWEKILTASGLSQQQERPGQKTPAL